MIKNKDTPRLPFRPLRIHVEQIMSVVMGQKDQKHGNCPDKVKVKKSFFFHTRKIYPPSYILKNIQIIS